MGAGGQPVGPGMFKAALADTPREAFNVRLVFGVICFGLMVLAPTLYLFLQNTDYSIYRELLEVWMKVSLELPLHRKASSLVCVSCTTMGYGADWV